MYTEPPWPTTPLQLRRRMGWPSDRHGACGPGTKGGAAQQARYSPVGAGQQSPPRPRQPEFDSQACDCTRGAGMHNNTLTKAISQSRGLRFRATLDRLIISTLDGPRAIAARRRRHRIPEAQCAVWRKRGSVATAPPQQGPPTMPSVRMPNPALPMHHSRGSPHVAEALGRRQRLLASSLPRSATAGKRPN